MLNVRSHLFQCCAFCLLFLLAGCAADRKGPVANIYHNITARYNGYFLAREKMEEVENAFTEAQERNFNKLLYLFPEVDTTVSSALKPQLEEVLKKASIAIERHKHSKWVDDSYILVGKARFYGGEYKHAVETFKYVNVNSEDDNARHLALINLMRTFVDYKELNNAKGVADYLRKENLNSENLRKLNLVKAYFYRQREDWKLMAAALEEAAPKTAKKEGRARLYFILGQLYQILGEDENAYKSFSKTLKSNPDYELSFYARMNMAQVANISRGQDEKKIRRYFSKLLRDKKNKEYRDKIFYEIGNFEARQGNLDAAISNYKKSAAASINNTRQKSYAYLKLAEVYYDSIQNFQLAKVYYDSTMIHYPEDEVNFARVQQRQEVLADLVKNLNTIQEQDSLLQLVQMDSVRLWAFLENTAREELAEQRRLEQLAARRNTLNQVNVRPGFNTVQDNFGLMPTQGGSTGEWYFYNLNQVSIGQAEFVKNWGDRPLQDNWRILNRNLSENTNVVTQQQQTEQFPDGPTDSAPAVLDEATQITNRTGELYATLPLSPEQQAESLSKVETALFKLGKIYNYQLEEQSRAIGSFDNLLKRFPSSEFRPEVLYELYLLHKGKNNTLDEQYKEELIAKHPETSFAKVAANPNYLEETDQLTGQLKERYAQAYVWYEQGQYNRADSLLTRNLKMFPDNGFSDQLRLLQILVTGKTEGAAKYQYGLSQFIEQTQNERLRTYASELLQASYSFKENSAKREGTRYIEDFQQPHYFLLMYENENKLADTLIKAVDSFNLNNHASAQLSATNLKFTGNTYMVYVSQFPNRVAAMQYFRDFERSKPLPAGAQNANANFFVISKDNFQILYDSKDSKSYLKFFNKFYN